MTSYKYFLFDPLYKIPFLTYPNARCLPWLSPLTGEPFRLGARARGRSQTTLQYLLLAW